MISVVFYERAQLTTGGAIVPAYLALSVTRPLAVIVTVGVGYLTHLVVRRGVARTRASSTAAGCSRSRCSSAWASS